MALTRSKLLSLASFFTLVGSMASACGGDGGGDVDLVDEGEGGENEPSEGEEGEEPGMSGGGASTGGGEPLTFCDSDRDCRDTDQLCDLDRLVCADCLENSHCGEDGLCQEGECHTLTPCESTLDCPIDEICADDAGYCLECERDADCEGDAVCVSYACFFSCDSDRDCRENNEVCDLESQICVSCVRDADCADDEFCNGVGACDPRLCEEGAGSCSDDVAYRCNESGSAYESEACAFGCDGAGCATEPDVCERGDIGCECYPNDTCNGDLSCEGGTCVTSTPSGDCDPKVRVLLQRSGLMFESPALADNWWDAVAAALDNAGTDVLDTYSSQMDLSLTTFYQTPVSCPILTGVSGPLAPNSLEAFLDAQEASQISLGMTKTDAPLPEAITDVATDLGAMGERYILLITSGTPDSCEVQDDPCITEDAIAAIQAAHAAGVKTKLLYLNASPANQPLAQGMANAGAGEGVGTLGFACGLDGPDIYSETPGMASHQYVSTTGGVAAGLEALFGEIASCE